MQQTMNQEASGMMGGAQKQKGLIAGVVAMAILACGGIGFGIYGMNEADKKSSEISDLKVQIEDKDGAVTTLETDEIKVSDDAQTITISDSNVQRKNPVISAEAPKFYNLGVESATYPVGGTDYLVSLNIRNGEVDGCSIFTYSYNDGERFNRDCDGVSGFSGKIYKAVGSVGEGQDGTQSSVVFIMEDGTVEYVTSANLVTGIVNSGTASVTGTLDIDGFVTDAFIVGAGEEGAAGGYATTIFVLSDGSYIKYDASMLK